MTPVEKQIAALEEKIAKERAKLADAKAKAAAQVRKRDTRKKILLGYAFLDWLTTLQPAERKRQLKLVHSRLKDRERKAFPLEQVLWDVAAATERISPVSVDDTETAHLPFPSGKP